MSYPLHPSIPQPTNPDWVGYVGQALQQPSSGYYNGSYCGNDYAGNCYGSQYGSSQSGSNSYGTYSSGYDPYRGY